MRARGNRLKDFRWIHHTVMTNNTMKKFTEVLMFYVGIYLLTYVAGGG